MRSDSYQIRREGRAGRAEVRLKSRIGRLAASRPNPKSPSTAGNRGGQRGRFRPDSGYRRRFWRLETQPARFQRAIMNRASRELIDDLRDPLIAERQARQALQEAARRGV